MEYRHELKFLVTEETLQRIRYRLMPLMIPDSHQGPEGYTIRSLYFDDFADSAVADILAGVDDRAKYRIRIYDGKTSFIRLEKKSKRANMCKKESKELTVEECRQYMAGVEHFMVPEMQAKHMRPVCIVEYDRYAYTYPIGNVRITFDRNIRGSARIQDFLNEKINCVPALGTNQHILEIKYDEVLPQFIAESVDTGNLLQQSFSKYYYARKAVGITR